MTLSIVSEKTRFLLVDQQACDALQLSPTFDWFSPDYWATQNAISATAEGRGTTYFVKQNDTTLVLRHYRRGGLMRHLSHDSFVFLGLKKTRPWRELSLLQFMNEQGLAVPQGIAGCVTKRGMHYTADILTICINDSRDVHSVLCAQSLDADNWQRIGKAIKHMHDAQVYHHDLNIHNILRDDSGDFWIIDFDKCAQRPGHKWKADNLARLARSLAKEQSRHTHYYYDKQDWDNLLLGYDTDQTSRLNAVANSNYPR